MIPVRSMFRNLTAAAALFAVLFLFSPAEAAGIDEAVRLYDAGRYAEAKPLLEKIVAAGNADGITHYRLYFCQRTGGDPGHRETLETARRLLEKEVASAGGFEAAFYLSNTYANLGLTSEVPRLSAAVTGRFEAGEIEAPTTPVEQFRLGKLYADQPNDRVATPWFEKALDGFEASGDATHRPYLEWGARWLAQRAMSEERYEAAARQLRRLTSTENAALEDLERLARASLLIGDYTQAQKAWNRAVVKNPINADPYRYGSALAQLCRGTAEIPISPDGERGWNELSDDELAKVLSDQAQVVRTAKTEAAAIEKLTREQRTTFNTRILTARPLFVGAALESVRRGINLRESAFFGGYAPLIFHAREWRLPDPPRRTKRGNYRELLTKGKKD